MANKNSGQGKGGNKKDKKAKKRAVRMAVVPKIKGSKEHRGCGPIGRKRRAENAFREAHKDDKWLKAQMFSNNNTPKEATGKAAPTFKFVEGTEKPVATSSSFYNELASLWGAD